MQTFVTRFSDGITASDLDTPRLGKQRLETLQILKVLTGESEAWKNHPAVGMWRGYEMALCNYGSVMCLKWRLRGHKDTLAEEFALRQRDIRNGIVVNQDEDFLNSTFKQPPWRRDTDVLISHRSNLIRKDPERYQPMFPDQHNGLPYLWPRVDCEGGYKLFISQSELARIDTGLNGETLYNVPGDWDINPNTGEVHIS